MDVIAIFARNVRVSRKAKGLSQEELAFRAGMKRSYVSDLENRKRNPTVRALGRLALALDVAPASLLSRDPDFDDGIPDRK